MPKRKDSQGSSTGPSPKAARTAQTTQPLRAYDDVDWAKRSLSDLLDDPQTFTSTLQFQRAVAIAVADRLYPSTASKASSTTTSSAATASSASNFLSTSTTPGVTSSGRPSTSTFGAANPPVSPISVPSTTTSSASPGMSHAVSPSTSSTSSAVVASATPYMTIPGAAAASHASVSTTPSTTTSGAADVTAEILTAARDPHLKKVLQDHIPRLAEGLRRHLYHADPALPRRFEFSDALKSDRERIWCRIRQEGAPRSTTVSVPVFTPPKGLRKLGLLGCRDPFVADLRGRLERQGWLSQADFYEAYAQVLRRACEGAEKAGLAEKVRPILDSIQSHVEAFSRSDVNLRLARQSPGERGRVLAWSPPGWGQALIVGVGKARLSGLGLPTLDQLRQLGLTAQVSVHQTPEEVGSADDPAVDLAVRLILVAGVLPSLTSFPVPDRAHVEEVYKLVRDGAIARNTQAAYIRTDDRGRQALLYGNHAFGGGVEADAGGELRRLMVIINELNESPEHVQTDKHMLWTLALQTKFREDVARALTDFDAARFLPLALRARQDQLPGCQLPGNPEPCAEHHGGHFCFIGHHSELIECAEMASATVCRAHYFSGTSSSDYAISFDARTKASYSTFPDHTCPWAAQTITYDDYLHTAFATEVPAPSSSFWRLASSSETRLLNEVEAFILGRGPCPPGLSIKPQQLATKQHAMLDLVRSPTLSASLDRKAMILAKVPSLDRLLPVASLDAAGDKLGLHALPNLQWTSIRHNRAKMHMSPEAARLSLHALYVHNVARCVIGDGEADRLLDEIARLLHDEADDCRFLARFNTKRKPSDDMVRELIKRTPHLLRNVPAQKASLDDLIPRVEAVQGGTDADGYAIIDDSGAEAKKDPGKGHAKQATGSKDVAGDVAKDAGQDDAEGVYKDDSQDDDDEEIGYVDEDDIVDDSKDDGPAAKLRYPARDLSAFVTKEARDATKAVVRQIIARYGHPGIDASTLLDEDGLPSLYPGHPGWYAQLAIADDDVQQEENECDRQRELPEASVVSDQEEQKARPLQHYNDFGAHNNSAITMVLTHLIAKLRGSYDRCHGTGLPLVGRHDRGTGSHHPLLRSASAHRVHGLPMSHGWRQKIPRDLDKDYNDEVRNVTTESWFFNKYRGGFRKVEATLTHVLEVGLAYQGPCSLSPADSERVRRHYSDHSPRFVSADPLVDQNVLHRTEQARFVHLSGARRRVKAAP